MSFEWTELTYQQIIAGNTAVIIFPLVVLLAFLVLAAQYESLTLPLAVILIMPMVLLSAITGVQLTHGDSNIFTQIGLIPCSWGSRVKTRSSSWSSRGIRNSRAWHRCKRRLTQRACGCARS